MTNQRLTVWRKVTAEFSGHPLSGSYAVEDGIVKVKTTQPLPGAALGRHPHRALDFTRPGFEGGALLGVEAVALIDADNTGSRSTDMTEHCLDHLQTGSEALQSGGDGAAQIVDAPRRNLGDVVKPSLASGKVGDRIAAGDSEHKVAGANPW